jgi:diacylglycerol kinase family enzyme
VRALLIVNPRATSTTEVRREVIVHALASKLDLEVVQTRYRGHASSVAEAAARDGYGLVLTLGGDGTVNESINGLLRAHPPASAPPVASVPRAGPGGTPPASAQPGAPLLTTGPGSPRASARPGGPLFAALPGGNANVFTRALGLPPDPVDATGWVLASLSGGRTRTIGLGLAGDRYFCFNAGLGLDAEVVRVVEGLRARGRAASAALYVWAAARQFSSVTNRREPALTLERDGAPAVGALFLGLVSNTCPWTYLGERPVRASPEAGFDTGLDLLALRRLSTLGTLNALRQMLGRDGGPSGKHVVTLHDQDALTFRADRPVAVQLDGEYVGEREHVMLRSIPNALRVLV